MWKYQFWKIKNKNVWIIRFKTIDIRFIILISKYFVKCCRNVVVNIFVEWMSRGITRAHMHKQRWIRMIIIKISILCSQHKFFCCLLNRFKCLIKPFTNYTTPRLHPSTDSKIRNAHNTLLPLTTELKFQTFTPT